MENIQNTRFSADESADILTESLQRKSPFIYVRFGDGALECIFGKVGRTCDGEVYTDNLGAELKRVWSLLFTKPHVYVGDWFSASFDPQSMDGLYKQEYLNLIGSALNQVEHRLDGSLRPTYSPNWIHFESLLFMRDSTSLIEFYYTVRNDSRKKLLMGPKAWAGAATILKCEFLEIPLSPNLFRSVNDIKLALNGLDFDVLLYGAGMAGNIPVIDLWNSHPERTYINLGSALDPIYRGQTRKQQIPHKRAVEMFESIVT